MSKNNRVLVYTDGGEGASPDCVAMTVDSLVKSLPPDHTLATTTSEELRVGHWMKDTRLLVMPGGRDLPYTRDLEGTANDNIRQFVASGGSYLGLCAGAYYGCARVEFAEGDSTLEVLGSRELQFYPGTGLGPHYPGFNYSSNIGARAASITVEDETNSKLSVFYNGGGTFIPFEPPNERDCQVLARYADTSPCVVLCRSGRGRVLLSGVHLEASAHMLRSCYHDDCGSWLVELERCEQQREELFTSFIKLLLTNS